MMMAEVQPRVFISYARSDDEPFVERLHRDLETAGITVWWDRDKMASRDRTFLQEIRDAIEAVDRVIAVIGPRAIHSDYVRYEWEHALLFAKSLLPILRLGDYRLVPSELLPENDQGLAVSDLGRLHCPDFRAERAYEKALDELIAIIRRPVPRLASYDGTPALPPHFLPRRDDLRRLKEAVLADVLRPTVITSAKQTVAMQGMGGIGKSVLAAAFARAISTRRAMGDGIVWLTFGREATKLDLLNNIKDVGLFFKDDIAQYTDEVSARARLPEVLADKVSLIVLDDVWFKEHLEPFVNALGPRCRLLITTRDGGLVTAFGAQQHSVDVLSDAEALALLAEWSGQPADSLPPEAGEVAEQCGNLPLALAMIGAMVRDNPARWENALRRLHRADLDKIRQELPNYPYHDLLRAIQVSVDCLKTDQQARYWDLAVFPEDTPVPEAALQALWALGGLDELDVQDVLDLLVRRSLVRRDEQGRITLHSLQSDYVRKQTDDLPALHQRLLRAYEACCPNGWATGPDDGYFFQFLPYHLAKVGREDEFKALLTDYAWLAAKLKATDVPSVLADYQRVPDEPHLRLIERALRLSTGALARDPHHLPSQLIGRLRGVEDRRVQALLETAEKAGAGPGTAWLCPHTASLLPPGPLVQTFTDHTDSVTALAVLPDGRVVSDSLDGTLRVWEVDSGASRVLTDHANRVSALAVLPDGRVVSGSDDDTLRVWEVASGTSRVLEGHRGSVTALAVLPDGRVVSGSDDDTLRVWEVASGTSRVLEGHTGQVSALTVLPDGRVVSGSYSNEILRVWEVDSSASRVLEGHTDSVRALAVLPDGRVMSGSADRTLRVWDVDNGASRVLTGHTDSVTALAVLPDGRVMSGSNDWTVILWDLEIANPISAFVGDAAITACAAVSIDRLVVGSENGAVHILGIIAASVSPRAK